MCQQEAHYAFYDMHCSLPTCFKWYALSMCYCDKKIVNTFCKPDKGLE